MAKRAITEEILGAWVFKADGRRFDESIAIRSRCVADNYRKDLMRPGQRVVLWVSGPGDGPRPRGIWGLGWITDEARSDPDDGWVTPADITLLAEGDRVLATDLREIPELADMEVLKLPQGSNPSWVTREQLAAIVRLLPEWPALQ
ncbi:EVE domain-containing protein [Williamsia maris]|uniref:EVE domain-containing protein n=1 Tax=Williamsia maris TaxID=72806 RepID=A0ABT1HDK4_9NOCA|nr:EVE domain-containing protein [Williamsia maris]MCP2176244.1 hypothetical protein [Williamsia maris]